MLFKIITKEVGSRILDCLFDGEASLSEVSRKTGTTKANVFRALREMEREDIVRKTVRGKTHVYKINFLHRHAALMAEVIITSKREKYSGKMGGAPCLIHAFLSAALKDNYKGCIFFGSSISRTDFNDIDVFVVTGERKKTGELTDKLKLIDKRVSPLFGSVAEIETGVANMDMLYKNIMEGVQFGIDVFQIRYRDAVLRKQDITERFIMAYREVLSCIEFKESSYRKIHLEKGITDLIYSILNYFDISPKNGREAVQLFKKTLKEARPETVKEALDLIKKYSWIL